MGELDVILGKEGANNINESNTFSKIIEPENPVLSSNNVILEKEGTNNIIESNTFSKISGPHVEFFLNKIRLGEKKVVVFIFEKKRECFFCNKVEKEFTNLGIDYDTVI